MLRNIKRGLFISVYAFNMRCCDSLLSKTVDLHCYANNMLPYYLDFHSSVTCGYFSALGCGFTGAETASKVWQGSGCVWQTGITAAASRLTGAALKLCWQDQPWLILFALQIVRSVKVALLPLKSVKTHISLVTIRGKVLPNHCFLCKKNVNWIG